MIPSSRCRLRRTADQLVDLGRPQPRHHLVEQQQRRARRERARHLQPPAIGERQVRGEERRLAGEAQALENGQGARAGAGDGAFAVQRAHDRVVEHREPRERLDELEGAADAGRAHPVRRQAADRAPAETDRAGVRPMQAGDEVEERRLAGAVRADERGDRVALDREGRPRDRAQAAKRLADLFDFEERHVRAFLGSNPSARASGGQRPFGM